MMRKPINSLLKCEWNASKEMENFDGNNGMTLEKKNKTNKEGVREDGAC